MRTFAQKPNLTPKIALSSPALIDKSEQARISEQAIRAPKAQLRGTCSCGGGCSKCRRPGLSETADRVHGVVQSPGQPLESAVRAQAELRLGYDFSRVRVHHDDAGADSARLLRARAYTYGHHVVFAAGQYRPGTPDGDALLRHELWHNVQQRAGTAADVLQHPHGTQEKEARIAGLGRQLPSMGVVGGEVSTPVLQCNGELDAFIESTLGDEPLPAMITDRVGPILGPAGEPVAELAALPIGATHNLEEEILAAIDRAGYGTDWRVRSLAPNWGGISEDVRNVVRRVTDQTPQVRLSSTEVHIYLRQQTILRPIILRVRIRSQVFREVVRYGSTYSMSSVVRRSGFLLLREAFSRPTQGGEFTATGTLLPPTVLNALRTGQGLPESWPVLGPPERTPVAQRPTSVGRPSAASAPRPPGGPPPRPAPRLNVPQPVQPVGMTTPTTINYRLRYRMPRPDLGTTGFEFQWEMEGEAPPINEALGAQGRSPLPIRGRLWASVKAAGDIVQTSGSNLPPSLEVLLARQAVANARAPIAGDPELGNASDVAPGDAAPVRVPTSRAQWAGRIVIAISIAEGLREVLTAAPGEELRAASGVIVGAVASFAANYILCNIVLGTTGPVAPLACGLIAGAVGGALGREAANRAFVALPSAVPGALAAGGGLRGLMSRGEQGFTRVRQQSYEPGRSSGGQRSLERHIESAGARALADLVEVAGTFSPAGARRAALEIERAIETAAGREAMLVSGGPLRK